MALRQRHREVACTLRRRCKLPAAVGGGGGRRQPRAEGLFWRDPGVCAAWNMNRVVGLPRGAPQNKPQGPQVFSSRGRSAWRPLAGVCALEQMPRGSAALSKVLCLTTPYFVGLPGELCFLGRRQSFVQIDRSCALVTPLPTWPSGHDDRCHRQPERRCSHP